MDRRAVRRVRGLTYCFRHRWMRVDRANQLFDRAFEPERQRCFGNELRRARPNHVDAENLVVLLVGNDFDESLDLVGDAGAGQDAELERTNADVIATLTRLALGQADAADLGIAVGAARHLIVVDGPEVLAGDPLRQRHAFRRRQVRELRMARLRRT